MAFVSDFSGFGSFQPEVSHVNVIMQLILSVDMNFLGTLMWQETILLSAFLHALLF
jgi:hypothetical protein